jgi:hypothetical protein
LTEFLSEKDHNLMVFADKESRKHVRKLVNNFGVDFEPYVSVLSRVLTPIEMPVVVLSERQHASRYIYCGIEKLV